MIRLENSLAFNYGIGVFETMRLVDGKIEYFDDHLERLMSSLTIIKVDSFSLYDIKRKIDNYLFEGSITNGIVKVLINDAGIFISYRENSYRNEDYSNGLSLKISDVQILPKSVYTIKSSNYMINYLESAKAKEEGYDEVLFFNTDKFLAEGS
ncbi:MAG: aminotransferase class IV, partial [Bacillota bacterium]|nr:aminotransferase class IV [Bacillota bacterium]